MTKPILIAGAGLSSLLLARSLLRSRIPFLVFERDASIVFRAQGYRLRLSPEGLDAIESVLDPQSFKKFYDRCGKTGGAGFAAVDPLTGETLGGENQSASDGQLSSRENKIVGIARGEMRALFLEGCEDYVRWNKHITGYEKTRDGVHAVFADGTKSVEGAMLIGGEGIHSKVSKQLTDGKIKHYDLGARGIHGQAPTMAFKGLGEGVFRLVDDKSYPDVGKLFVITNVRPEEMNDPNVMFGWTMVGTQGMVKAPDDNDSVYGKPAADLAKDLTKNWHPRVKPLFDDMDEADAAFWKITCSSPEGVPEWHNEPRITIVGDAAHSMTPAGGNGANTAMRDSALLGGLLAEAGGFKEGITEEYEKKMRVYASEAVKKSYGQATGMWGVKIDLEKTPSI